MLKVPVHFTRGLYSSISRCLLVSTRQGHCSTSGIAFVTCLDFSLIPKILSSLTTIHTCMTV
jgi:hypothetical protein